MTNDSDHIVTESAARIFADLADPQTINRLDNGAWKAPFWQALCDAGLPLAWVPERLGGAGATLAEGTLDDKGFARVDGIDPGSCKVTFPKLDKTVWKPK